MLVVFLSLQVPTINAATQDASVPRNVVLFYDDYQLRGDPAFQITKEIARPLVGYIDTSGKPVNWMFDTIILYNLWLYFEFKPTTTVISQWSKFLFSQRQLSNLDAAVGEAKAALNRPSYRMNVVITIPVAYDAINEAAITKNVKGLMDQWNKLNPKNLRLIGFYWGFTENLDDYSYVTGLTSLVPKIASYIHSKNMKLFMIPYQQRHLADLRSAGFDYLTLQPNYHIDPNSDLSRFSAVDQAIKAGYVSGVHFEIPFSDNPILCCQKDWRTNLQTYFQEANSFAWYKDIVATYYHGSVISQMGRSSSADDRAAYNTIYQYIQETITQQLS
jgi:hypothetical protein